MTIMKSSSLHDFAYHSSPNIIETPVFLKSRGFGFYAIGENVEIWVAVLSEINKKH